MPPLPDHSPAAARLDRAGDPALPIAVIGAGFSGTMAALQLAAALPQRRILLLEKTGSFGRGLAYEAGADAYLLNVRAANMSAYPDRPADFETWLAARPAHAQGIVHTDAGAFVERRVYGAYLADQLAAAPANLSLRQAQITNITQIAPPGGGTGAPTQYRLAIAGGETITAAGVVLALGNLPAAEDPQPRICANPWSARALAPLDPAQPVLIVGTGLTMVDLALALRRRAPNTPLIALSRGGLLPQPHAPLTPRRPPYLTRAEETSLPRLLARIRTELREAEAAGQDWRAVIDSLRPLTAHLWARQTETEHRRFLRHLRRYWDVHRHRMAPPNAQAIAAMRADGSLRVIAARLLGLSPGSGSVDVAIRRHGAASPETLSVQRVILASGLIPIGQCGDPLINALIQSGLARIDRTGLGLDVTPGLNVIGEAGRVTPNLWALGPLVRGVFWECVAVPDIRVQAAFLARAIAATWHDKVWASEI